MIRAYLGLDYGEKRVGVAVGNDVAKLASPLVTLPSDDKLVGQLLSLAEEQEASLAVVGLPRGLDGQETTQTGRARAFAEQLEAAGLPVELQDEAASSELAVQRGAKADKIDQEAAVIILQDYLDNL